MNDMSMTTIQAAPETPAIVVFGRDNSHKPHASCFDENDAELARISHRELVHQGSE
jgi:hypothetical protein